jgi:hypothetical protein
MGRQDRTLAILAALRGHWISGLVTDQISFSNPRNFAETKESDPAARCPPPEAIGRLGNNDPARRQCVGI